MILEKVIKTGLPFVSLYILFLVYGGKDVRKCQPLSCICMLSLYELLSVCTILEMGVTCFRTRLFIMNRKQLFVAHRPQLGI